ncbi:MAG: UbiX family flavin prenyltransferase [Methylococcales bacterium]|jgi:flavin prenyltransferase|nr:UbiX family flavin prenyltransferase [Methylococcales bacterium]MBT7409071.1 UbiX family flavin prenyltransferase [Methylococcales bacterium]
MKNKPITLIFTGASGAAYGLRLLEYLVSQKKTLIVLMSDPAKMVINMETELKIPNQSGATEAYLTKWYNAAPGQITFFSNQQWMAPIASGSGVSDHTVVCPCTTGTLSAIANGSSHSLIERAADVAIKERKTLILVVRETPFSSIHLENMLKLSNNGVIILPANPGYYNNPKSVADIIDFVVSRILDQLNIEHDLMPVWGESNS